MGIQINGNNDIISALDGSWTAEGASINTSGILTATTFKGNVTGTACTFVDGKFTGNVTIGGTLTYEDVTNIDAVGLITARNGIIVTAGVSTFAAAINANGGANVVGVVTASAGIIDSTLTANRVVYVDSDKSLTDSANLTFNGNNLQFNTTANGHAVILKSTGNYYNKLSFDSGNTAAGGELAYVDFSWDGDKVADIQVLAGSDTTNKDDGHLVFRTSPSQGSIGERLRITSAGKVGINSTSPTYALEVDGGTQNTVIVARSSDTRSQISFLDNATTGYGHVAVGCEGNDLFIRTGTGSKTLTITSGGVVLIGKTTTSWTEAGVRIDGDGAIMSIRTSTSTNQATANGGSLSLINYSATDNNFSHIGGYNSNSLVTSQINFVNTSHSSRTGDITFMTHNGSSMPERLRITSGGRVNIGQASDVDHTLCVAGTDDTTSLTGGHNQGIQLQNKSTTDGTYSQIEWRTSSGGRYARIAGIQDDANGNGGQLVFLTETSGGTTTERLRIRSNGYMGVGNFNSKPTAITDPLNVDSGIGTCNIGGNYIHLKRYSGGNTQYINAPQNNANLLISADDFLAFGVDHSSSMYSMGTEALRIDSSGRIGLGIDNPGDYFSSYNRVVMGRTNDTGGMTIVSANDSAGYIAFADGTSGNQAYRGRIIYSHGGSPGDYLRFDTDSTEKLRITSDGHIDQNLTTASGTSPFQNTNWYDRDGGKFTLTYSDFNEIKILKLENANDYNRICYRRERMSHNCDIEFDLEGNVPNGTTYRHVGFVINGDGTGTASNFDRMVFRTRPGNTNNNQIRLDKGGGGYGFNIQNSNVPSWFDGNSRHIKIQIRRRIFNVFVNGEILYSETTDADLVRTQGYFGVIIYESGTSSPWVKLRNFKITNRFTKPQWLARASGVNVDVASGDPFPFNQSLLVSANMSGTSYYNTSTYKYTIPITGTYYIFHRVYRNSSTSAEVAYYVNNNVRIRFRPLPQGGDYIFAGSAMLVLDKDDTVSVNAYNGQLDNFYGNSSEAFSSWGGHLIE